MEEIVELTSRLPFWDGVAAAAAIALVIGAIVSFVAEFTTLVPRSWKTKVRVGCAATLIAASGTQVVAQLVISAINNKVVAYLNDRTATANREAKSANLRAEAAHERATGLELETEKQKAINLDLETQLRKVDSKYAWRNISARQRDRIVKEINGRQRPILIIRLREVEARSLAEDVFQTLKAANFTAKMEDLDELPPDTGVILCEKHIADLKLFQELRGIGVATKFVSQKSRLRPDFCDGFIFDPQNITRILVGQRPRIR